MNLKKIIPEGFKKVVKELIGWNRFSMIPALKRSHERGVSVNTVLDIGASDGRWSKDCLRFFPDAKYLLVEAQRIHEGKLLKFKKKHANTDYYLGAASDTKGNIYFDVTEAEGGLASHSELIDREKVEIVPANTVDNLVVEFKLSPPFLIKLDTHGFEIPILEGASDTLVNSNLVIIESYNYQLTNTSLKFYELCEYMSKIGFFPIDIADVSERKYDKTFWQMDIFFIKKGSKEFQYNKHS